jgi:hypothetical protein
LPSFFLVGGVVGDVCSLVCLLKLISGS